MTDEENLGRLLREALPPLPARGASGELWERLEQRERPMRNGSWVDLGIAAAVVLALSVSPRWIWILLFYF